MGVLNASTSPPKERYAGSKDNILQLIQPGIVDDHLTEILRHGARGLLSLIRIPKLLAAWPPASQATQQITSSVASTTTGDNTKRSI